MAYRYPQFTPPRTSTSVDFAFTVTLGVEDDFDWPAYILEYAIALEGETYGVQLSSDQDDDRLTLDVDSKTLTVRIPEGELDAGRYHHEARMTSVETGETIILFEGWPTITEGLLGARAPVSSAVPSIMRSPSLIGTAAEGQTITVKPGLYNGVPRPTIARQWLRDGVEIVGETGTTYVIQGSDIGSTLAVIETATNTLGSVTATSSGFGPIFGADTVPDVFVFTDVTGQPTSTLVESNAITVSGINAPAAITVTGGSYRINGGAWTGSPGTVLNGDVVSVRHSTSSGASTVTNTTLTIGGVSNTFTSTTVGLPQTDIMLILGQSNAGGWAVDPANFTYTPDPQVKTWNGSAWVTYLPGTVWNEPGKFTGFTEETPGANWAAELTYAKRYREQHPENELRIVKYAYGGSTMYASGGGGFPDWNPATSNELFDHFNTFASNAVAAVEAEGKDANIRIMFLMQGEHDAYGGQAAAYDTNLGNFITAARAEWPIEADTPIVLGRLPPALISSFRTLRSKQVQVATADPNVYWITTDDCPWQEPHYDAAGYHQMGETIWAWDRDRPADAGATDYPVLFNPAARGPACTISVNGLTVTRSGGTGTTQAAFATKILSGKRMWQIQFTSGVVTSSGNSGFGIGDVSGGFSFSGNYPGQQKNFAVHYDGGYHVFNDSLGSGATNFGYANNTFSNNDNLSICVDIDAKLIWTAVNNGNWNNDASANPATGVGGKSFTGMIGPIAPCVILNTSSVAVLNAGLTAFSRAIPSGFLALSDSSEELFPTLANLTLTANAIISGSPAGTVVGAVVGKAPGSLLSMTNNAGGRFTISGSNVVAGATATNFVVAASHNVTVREALPGATNTPHDTVLAITVVEAGAGTFDAINKGADISLLGGGSIASRSGGAEDSQFAFSGKVLTGTKTMAEITLTAVGDDVSVGVGNTSLGLTAGNPDYTSHHKNAAVLWLSGYYAFNDAGDGGASSFGGFFGTALSAGDKIAIAVDEPNKKLWVARGTGNWNNDVSADPATGTGGRDITGMAASIKFLASLGDGATVTLNDGTTTFAKALPSGFSALKDIP